MGNSRIDGWSLLKPDYIHKLIEKLKDEGKDKAESDLDMKMQTKLAERRKHITKIMEIYTKIEEEYQLITEHKPPGISETELQEFTTLMASMPVFEDSRTLASFIQLMHKMTHLIKLRIRDETNSSGGLKFDASAFGKGFRKMAGHYQPHERLSREGWMTAGMKLKHLLRQAPKFASIGHLMSAENRSIVKVARARTTHTAKKEARTVLKEDKEVAEDASITKNIIHIQAVLRQIFEVHDDEPIPFFKFAVDPNDFSQSVENIFHLSFVVKDANARLALNEETDELEIRKVSKSERLMLQADDRSKSDTNQMFCGFDYYTWKKLIRKYDLKGKKPMIPHLDVPEA
uniref:Non-structural maintenance of chromosomes element 4 n=1 Tax=Steinernema glaseri TaxID=37863 RepID=A0A1I7YRR1_9BILA